MAVCAGYGTRTFGANRAKSGKPLRIWQSRMSLCVTPQAGVPFKCETW
jgi:hypothetical protein